MLNLIFPKPSNRSRVGRGSDEIARSLRRKLRQWPLCPEKYLELLDDLLRRTRIERDRRDRLREELEEQRRKAIRLEQRCRMLERRAR